jgi:hypothetical protein
MHRGRPLERPALFLVSSPARGSDMQHAIHFGSSAWTRRKFRRPWYVQSVSHAQRKKSVCSDEPMTVFIISAKQPCSVFALLRAVIFCCIVIRRAATSLTPDVASVEGCLSWSSSADVLASLGWLLVMRLLLLQPALRRCSASYPQ